MNGLLAIHGQLGRAQGPGRAPADRGRGRRAPLSPALFARPRPIERQQTAEGENAFAKLEALLRTAAERTIEGLWITIGKLLHRFSPAECQNYIENVG